MSDGTPGVLSVEDETDVHVIVADHGNVLVIDAHETTAFGITEDGDVLLVQTPVAAQTVELPPHVLLIDRDPEALVLDVDGESPVLILQPGGLPGARGDRGEPGATGETDIVRPAGETIMAYSVVFIDVDGLVYKVSSNDPSAYAAVGVTRQGALLGEPVTICRSGLLTTGGPFTVGRLYLQPDGSLGTFTRAGTVLLHVANALTPTLLDVRLEPAIFQS